MPPYIPFAGSFFAPPARNVYQAYQNPESPDAVRADMGGMFAPSPDYWGMDSQGNRKKFTLDNGQLARLYEDRAGSLAAATLQDARLKKAKSDIAFLQNLQGLGVRQPEPTPGPNVFTAPTNPDELRLQQMLQNRENAEARGWNLFGAAIDQRRKDELEARRRAKENLAYQKDLFGLKNAMEKAANEEDERQANRLELQANSIASKEKIASDKLAAKTQQNFQRALEGGVITNENDIRQFFGGKVSPQEMAAYKGQLNSANAQVSDQIGKLIADGKIQSIAQLQATEGGRLSSDQYAPLQNMVWQNEANKYQKYKDAQTPAIDALTTGMAAATKKPFADYQKLAQGPTGWWNGLRNAAGTAAETVFSGPANWLTLGRVGPGDMAKQIRPSGASPEEIAASKAAIDRAAQQYAAGALNDKNNYGSEIMFDPASKQFKVRPPTNPSDPNDLTFSEWMNLGKPMGEMYGPPPPPAETPSKATPFMFGPGKYDRSASINYQPDPYRFGGRPEYQANPSHFGESYDVPLPPKYINYQPNPEALPEPAAPQPALKYSPGGLPMVRTPVELAMLKPGTLYIDPRGQTRTKK